MDSFDRAALRKSARRLGLAITVAILPTVVLADPPTFNVNDAFVANEGGTPSNPNGSYTYGYNFDPTNPGAFSTSSFRHTDSGGFLGNPGVQGYYVDNNFVVPAVVGNVTNATINTVKFNVSLKPGELLLHPGNVTPDANQQPYADADLRYTVATGGTYSIAGLFEGLDKGPTDVSIRINGAAPAFSSALTGTGSSTNFGFTIKLAKNDVVDFLVGPGNPANIYNDSTGLFANISAVPEPATIVSTGLACGMAGLAFAWRRWKRTALA